MRYLYETHMHTCLASACGASTGKEHARRYHDLGFTGIIMTDHFFGGNTCVDRSLPWPEKVKRFCAGYEDAKEEGDRLGLQVFFGWEQGYGDDEYLVYGLDKAWLLAHPEIEHCSRARQLQLVHGGGGCVIQAHPFRFRPYNKQIKLGLRFCDGVEVANAGNQPVNDVYAWRFAREYGLVMTAGSDNHNSAKVNSAEELYGVALEQPLRDIHDYVSLILNRGPIHLHVPESRFVWDPAMPELKSWWLNEDESITPTGRTWKE